MNTNFAGNHATASIAPSIGDASVDPLLKDKESAAILGCSVPTFWRRVADGTIPRPVKIGGMSRWPRSEIIAVIDTAKAQRADAECPAEGTGK